MTKCDEYERIRTIKEARKTCTKCKAPKGTSEFNKDSSKPDGLCSWCKKCRRDNHYTYYRRHPEQIKQAAQTWRDADKERNRNSYRSSRYRLKPDQFQSMLDGQDGKCAVCGTLFSAELVPHIDHDHSCCPADSMTCGKCTRGLLCHACNKGLGYMRDNIEVLQGAVRYLQGADARRTEQLSGQ